ncbi:MAG: hypothetical protein M1827_007674 [Pycnora praestabilis]|nr:MAG: hypothetical protein M1827_007674 [Pycnora praestabilis]
MTETLVAVVTGANRGIGKAICQTLANGVETPIIIYAASRKGLDLGIKTSSQQTKIEYPKLDITDQGSIQTLADSIQKNHSGLQVLINNAGVNLDDDYSPENVKRTLDTNYRGTLKMCQTFIPLLEKDGRIVNVSSVGSSLNPYSNSVQERFRSPKMTLQDLENMAQEYQHCANEGVENKFGWGGPGKAYSVSKACINAFTAVLARENHGLIINACCPGWVSTDMGKMVGSRPPKSTADGAKIPIHLGFKDIGGVSGRYWANPSISDTGDGQVMTW